MALVNCGRFNSRLLRNSEGGSGALSGGLMDQAGIKPNRNYNALYVYALP